MRILVLGSGGREDAIAWALEWEHHANDDEVFVAPGNGGSRLRLDVDPTDPQAVVDLCRREVIDLVVVGPESSLAAGVSDALREASIPVFGPTAQAAMLETSKGFCRSFATKHSIPSPVSEVFAGPHAAEHALLWADQQSFEIVVKADGLAAGKGVVVTSNRQEALDHALACKRVVIEEFLDGPEVSLFGISDGTTIIPMQPAQDFKRALDGDAGPNTGGMGAYSPLPWAPSDIIEDTHTRVLAPMIAEMAARGTPFVGLLYAGLALTDHGTRVIEFNARFGDPETQVLIPRLKTPLATLLYNAATGNLSGTTLEWSDESAVTVVLAAQGYPAAPQSGGVISGFSSINNVSIFHAGTSKKDEALVSSGGRVLTVTGVGEDLTEARNLAYRAISQISLAGSFYRTDIALNASVAEKGN